MGLSLSNGFCVSVSFCVLGFLRNFLQLVEVNWWEDPTSLMDIRHYPTSLRPRLLTRARELRDKRRKSRVKREAKPEDPMRTCAATCCAAAAAPARQAPTVASHEKNYFPFFLLK